jgi:phosphatidylglycerol lysyltransferase
VTAVDVKPPGGRIARVLAHPALRIAVPVVVVSIALVVLYRIASHVPLAEVRADLATASVRSLALAMAATLGSFAALALYDVIAVRIVVPGRVPARIAALAGACGYAVSNLLGFSWLTGSAVRYRIYSALGLDAGQVAAVIALNWSAFWMGGVLIVGLLLVFHPVGLSAMLPLMPTVETSIGLSLLLGLVAFLIWLARGVRRLSLLGATFTLPDIHNAAFMAAVEVVDLLATSLVLYVLLPADLAQNFAAYFIVFFAAVSLGQLSHAPGGLGVFEASIVVGLAAGGRSDVLAALVLYRLIYTVMPFAFATLGLGVSEAIRARRRIGRAAGWTYGVVRAIAAPVAAGIALLSGIILLFSGNLPGEPGRLRLLWDVIPLQLIEMSHLVASIVGLLLIVIARGLYRRLYRAWEIAIVLLALGLVASLAKGLDWEKALLLLLAMGLLWLFRAAFYRARGAAVFHLNVIWIGMTIAVIGAAFWIGLFAYSHVAYRNALWWQFSLSGDASRFLRASLAVAVILVALGFNSLVMARSARVKPEAIPQSVRDLLAACTVADAQIALSGDKSFLVSPDARAFLAYADTGSSYIVNGDPVGAMDAACDLIWSLREKAERSGRRCAFYGVSATFIPTFVDLGLSIHKIGESARVALPGFTLEGPEKKDFRHAIAKAAREGYVFEIIPAAAVKVEFAALKRISDAWLEAKHTAEKGFSLGACTQANLENFDIAVLRRGPGGQIAAFANLLQGAGRHELSLDLMRHDPAGHGFVMDALFAHLMLWGRSAGFAWFSLGAAPLSGLDDRALGSAWNRIGGFIYAHGERFYRFEGLRAFKEKFDPDWSPVFLASPGGLAVAQVLWEVNGLVSGGARGVLGRRDRMNPGAMNWSDAEAER